MTHHGGLEEAAPLTARWRKPMVIFSAPLVKHLSTARARLPPTYIGVRRVRPSNNEVRSALLLASQPSSVGSVVNPSSSTLAASKTTTDATCVSTNNVVFKIVDQTTGVERRMTSQEKRAHKIKLREQNKLSKQQRERLEARTIPTTAAAATSSSSISEPLNPSPSCPIELDRFSPVVHLDAEAEDLPETSSDYVQLGISSSAMEQEISDLRGERDGVPPVALSPAAARIAILEGMIPRGGSDPHETPPAIFNMVVDDELAAAWAAILKDHMRPAEIVRRSEEFRQMPYELVPEVWSRLRPTQLGSMAGTTSPGTCEDEVAIKDIPTTSPEVNGRRDWAHFTMRPVGGDPDWDVALQVVAEVLHRGTSIYVACGAKFGCDFLVYDGPRHERHAFAGLRVLLRSGGAHTVKPSASAAADALPLPRAYDLTGYVRCLNTANKLALLATVVKDGPLYRVALVDLALVKIGSTKGRRPLKLKKA